jgi:hypothetical protein
VRVYGWKGCVHRHYLAFAREYKEAFQLIYLDDQATALRPVAGAQPGGGQVEDGCGRAAAKSGRGRGGGGCVEEGDVEQGDVEEPAEVRQRAQAQVEKPAREQDQATAIMLQQLLELERELKL